MSFFFIEALWSVLMSLSDKNRRSTPASVGGSTYLKTRQKKKGGAFWRLKRIMAFTLISMEKFALLYEQIEVRARSWNELNSYVKVPRIIERGRLG